MYFSSLNYNLLFILTLFNPLLSLLIGDSVFNMTDNYINNIQLNSSNNFSIKLNLNIEEKDYIYLSLISYEKLNFTIITNIINNNFINGITINSISKEISNPKIESGEQPFISISSVDNQTNMIQIIHIKNNSHSQYYNFDKGDDETVKINKNYYNLVKFLKNDEKKINVEIKFKDNLKNNIYYGIVRLLSKDKNYIPIVNSFKKVGLIDNYDLSEVKKKEKIIKIKDIEENSDTNIHKAFILSIDSRATINNDYSVIINEDIMNKFLLGSIIVALIFAVITFFLIRRKQNIREKKTGEEFLEEKQEEEKET